MRTILLVFCLLSTQCLAASGQDGPCDLNSTQIYNPVCEGLIVDYPEVIYVNRSFELTYTCCGNLSQVAVFSIASANSFCGVEDYVAGSMCSQGALQFPPMLISSNITCSGGPPSPAVGNASLIFTLENAGEVMTCNILLPIQWGQTTSIFLNREDIPMPINVTGQQYLIYDSSIFVNVSCIGVPGGTPPTFTYTPFTTTSTPSVPVYQNSSAAYINFPGGFTLLSSGIFTCTSASGYSVMSYIANPSSIGLPVIYFAAGDSISSVTGSPLTITAYILSDVPLSISSISFGPVTGQPSSTPKLSLEDGIKLTVTYDHISVPPTPIHQLCVTTMDDGSTSGLMDIYYSETCCENLTLIVTVPDLDISTSLLAFTAEEFSSGMINVTCTPSDPSAVVFWRNRDNLPVQEVYPTYQYFPAGLNHTMVLLSPPIGIEDFTCGLFNGEGVTSLLNSINVTVVSLSRPVSVFNNGQEMLDNAVINSFLLLNSMPHLSLRCFGLKGHNNLEWMTRNVSALPQNLTEMIVSLEPDLTVATSGRDTTLTYANLTPGRTGYYSCQSTQSGEKFDLFTTLDDPYWEVLSPPNQYPSVGTNVTLLFQYASLSQGHGNDGQEFLFSLSHFNSSSHLLIKSIFSDQPSEILSYQKEYRFMVNSSSQGLYTFSASMDDYFFEQDVLVLASIPDLTQVSTPVYALLNGIVSLTCFSNDTAAPITWTIKTLEGYSVLPLDDPRFEYNSPKIRNEIKFDLSSATLGLYGYDVDSTSISLVMFQCGFVDWNPNSLVGASDISLYVQFETIEVLNLGVNKKLLDNTTINYFPSSRKRNLMLGDYFSARCTTVQGNHDPQWSVYLATNDYSVQMEINSSFINGLYATQLNLYQNELTVYVNKEHEGLYTCQSPVSGVNQNFYLFAENPLLSAYFMDATPFLGDDVLLEILAVQDSTGTGDNSVDSVQIYLNTTDGTIVPVGEAFSICSTEVLECFNYQYILRNVIPEDTGIYIVQVADNECEVPNSPLCQYTQVTVPLTVEIPDLIPIDSELQLVDGQYLYLSCHPSTEISSYYIEWRYNGEVITEVMPEAKRAIPQEYISLSPTNTEIVIAPIYTEHSGTYTCTLIYNEMEITSQNIQVTVISVSPPIYCFSEYNGYCTGDFLEQVATVEQCCQELNGGGYTTISPEEFYYYYYYFGEETFPEEYEGNNYQCTSCLVAIPGCPRQFSAGVLWEETNSSSTVSIQCSTVATQFNIGPVLTRDCFEPGIWGPVDFSQCTLNDNLIGNLGVLSLVLTGVTLAEIEGNRTSLEVEMRNILDNNNITYTSVTTTAVYSTSVSIGFVIDLSPENSFQLIAVVDAIQISKVFGGYSVQTAEVSIIESADSCPCQQLSNVLLPEEELMQPLISLCMGSSTSPCSCVNQTCMCQTPFVGDGIVCILDTDGDLYPDVPLSTCVNSTETFCIQDNCPYVFNADQDSTACQTIPEFQGCPFGPDEVWGVTWSNTQPGNTDTQPCPGGVDVMGSATRYCHSDGEWQEANVINCVPVIFSMLENQANELLNNENLTLQEQLDQITQVTLELAVATSSEPGQISLLPSALNTTIIIITGVVDLLEESLQNESIVVDLDQLGIIDILDNCLDSNNENGWIDLQRDDIEGTSDSNNFLQDTERYGLYLAQSTGTTLQNRQNIALKTEEIVVNSGSPLILPQENDLEGSAIPRTAVQVTIPSQVLVDRANGGEVPVVSILFRHLEQFLTMADFNFSNTTVPGSLVWSGQVSLSRTSTDVPINLTFAFDTVENVSSYRCAYWDPTMRGGGWSTEGVRTVSNVTDENGKVSVHCQSNHLTAFVVLVDVSGEVRSFDPVHLKALQVVSYIGCAISVLCLVGAVIFFGAKGKQLLQSVHFLVHLNLSLSLLCGYLIFSVGVETAKNSTVGCAFVAALLHYFFLASFCWMLCEGIMLYLMLVVVFTSIAKKFYFFLIIGWVTPLLPVVIGLSAAHEHYGVRDENGDLQFCWLSVEGGTIWAFVAPMLIIIIINTVFLVLALRSIWKTKGSRRAQNLKEGDKRQLALDIFKASLILLPLLGVTWVFGMLTVNENTAVFAWLFTIFNSLQGVAIFFLHVIKSDKVWSRMSPHLKSLKRITLRSTLQSSYSLSDQDQSIIAKHPAYKRKPDRGLIYVTSESKQESSISDLCSENPTIEMKSVKVDKVGTAAEDNSISNEHKKQAMNAEHGVMKEKEVVKVDLSNQEETAIDMKEKQQQTQQCSSDPSSENPTIEMKSVVVDKGGIAAEDNSVPNEQQKTAMDAECGVMEEKEVVEADMSDHKETAIDTEEEQEQPHQHPRNAHSESHQSSQDEDSKSCSQSFGSECSNAKHATDPAEMPTENQSEKKSADDKGTLTETQEHKL